MKTNNTAKSLLELAKEKFSSLSAAEERLLLAVPQGEIADCTLGGNDDPAVLFDEDKANSWGEDRHIRAALLRWLAVAPEARARIDQLGIQLYGAAIIGELDISHADLPFPLVFDTCQFAEEPNFSHGHFRLLDFSGSASPGLRLASTRIDTLLNLTNILCHGLLLLQDARINDLLYAENARLENPDAVALGADRVRIQGGCYLNDFSAKGAVRFPGAKIDGNFECSSGNFTNENHVALDLSQAKIADSCFLRDKFFATGEVRLLGAEIGGNLECDSGTFINENGIALNLNQTVITNSCFLRNKFFATGEVRLLGAKIGGNLECRLGNFVNENGKALDLDGARISGNCFLDGGFSAKGEVRLLGTEINGSLRCREGGFTSPGGNTLNAEHARISNAVGLDSMKVAQGRFNFFRAEIGSLIFRKPPEQTDEFALNLRQAHCAALFDDPAAWEACTNYVLAGFHYDSLDNCSAPIVERLDWLRRADNGAYSPQPYEQLAKTLRTAGHPDEARDVLIEKEKRKPESWRRDTPVRKFMYYPRQALHWLHWLLVRYGYRPTVALAWVIALWVFGAGMFFVSEQRGAFFPAKDRVYVEAAQKCVVTEAVKRQGMPQGWLALFGAKEPPPCFAMPDAYPRLNVAMYSLDALVPFLDLHQEEYWLPDESKFVGQIATWYLWCHIIFGWLLATFGLAAITGLAKRE